MNKKKATIKLSDKLIAFASNANSRADVKPTSKLYEYKGVLEKVGGVINDVVLSGFHVKRTGKNTISFRYTYRTENGRQRTTTLGKFPVINVYQARELATKTALAVSNGVDVLLEKERKKDARILTLAVYLHGDYTNYKRNQCKSWKQRVRIIENAFNDLLSRPLNEVEPKQLEGWLNDQLERYRANEKGYSKATVLGRWNELKSLYIHAKKHDIVTSSPFDKLNAPKFNRDTSIKTQSELNRGYLTQDEQQRLLNAINAYDEKLRQERRNSRAHGKAHLPDLDPLAFASHHKPMFLILFYMGMRTGDLLNLKWSNVIDTPFTQNITKVLNKTAHSVPNPYVLPMPRQVSECLHDWKQQQQQQSGQPTKPDDLVFPSPRTGNQLNKRALDRAWCWIRQEARLHDTLNLYTLRHNFISWLVMQGVQLSIIAKLVGHTTIAMIESNYSHLAPSISVDASQSFADMNERGKNATNATKNHEAIPIIGKTGT